MSKAQGDSNGKRVPGAKAVPELVEDDAARSVLDVRTDTLQTLRELGPPDMVYLVKQSTKSSSKQVCPSCLILLDEGVETDLSDRHLSSCYRHRRVIISKPRCIHQYPHIHHQ